MKWVWQNLYWIHYIKFGIVLSPNVQTYKVNPHVAERNASGVV